MAAKNDNKKEIKKKLKKYLQKPSEELAAELLRSDYAGLMGGMFNKLSRGKMLNAVGLLEKDSSDVSGDLLMEISAGSIFPLDARIKAVKALEGRGKNVAERMELDKLEGMVGAAVDDDEKAASRFVADADEKELEAWAEIIVEKKAVKALVAAAVGAGYKRGEKIFKRAAYELRSKGVEVPEWEEKGASVLKPTEKAEPVTMTTILDGTGGRALFLYLPMESSDVHIVTAWFDDSDGFKDYQGGDAPRGSARTFKKKLESEKEYPFYRVPVEYAAYLLDRAAATTAKKGLATPPGYADTRTMLRKYLTDYAPPEPRSLISEEPEASDARESMNLFDIPTFMSWAPDVESLESCGMKLDQALASTLVISEAQRMEQIEKAFEDSAATFLTGETRSKLTERLNDTARVYAFNGEVEKAKWALATATEINAEGSLPLFVVEMFRRAFPDIHKDQLRDGTPKSDGAPDSGSGIIIP